MPQRILSLLSIVWTGLMLFSFKAWAFEEGRFYSQESLSKAQSLREAIPAVFLLESSSGRCTATFISNQGHFLTARHCLQRCLLEAGVFKFTGAPGGLSYLSLEASAYGQKSCVVQLNHQAREAVVVATSEGFISKMDERGFQAYNPDQFEEKVQRGFTFKGDFVIAQLREQASTVCLKLQENLPQVNEPVLNLAYPSETFRADGFDSDGKSLYWSRGLRVEGIEQNSCLRDTEVPPTKMRDLKRVFDDSSGLLLSFDSIYGSSGSPALNTSNEIVAILTNVFRFSSVTGLKSDEPENRYCAGSTKALNIASLRELLQRQGLDLATFSNCQ